MPQLRYSPYMAKKRHIQKRQVFALYSFFVFEHTTSFFCCIKHVILLCSSLFSSLEWWSPKRNESCNPFILSYNITPNGFISKSEWVKCNSKIRRKTWHLLLKETDVASSKKSMFFLSMKHFWPLVLVGEVRNLSSFDQLWWRWGWAFDPKNCFEFKFPAFAHPPPPPPPTPQD